jgi:hypothetical protein
MLAPQWFRVRIGPYIRRELDRREYFRLFHSDGYISGFRRYGLLLTSRRICAENLEDLGLQATVPTVVVFRNAYARNLSKYFSDVVGHHDLLHAELQRITRPAYRPPPMEEHVAVHVRMGDFRSDPSVAELNGGESNSRLPIEWYVQILDGLRTRSRRQLPAIVYSDGPDASLQPLLRMQAVVRAPPAASITDMLKIAQAKALISSGSGFSVWASFLGQVPRICFPGQRMVRAIAPGELEREPECDDSSQIPSSFVDFLKVTFDR